MSRSSYWFDLARKAAAERQETYGEEPGSSVARLLAAGSTPGLWGTLRLAVFVLAGAPRYWLYHWWRRLTDRDTPRRLRLIEELAADLRGSVSADCRVVEGYLQRRLSSRDLARVPPLLEHTLFRTTPHLLVQPTTEPDVAQVLCFASRRQLAVYPSGTSSSAFGGSVPTDNGVALDVSQMTAVLGVDREQQTVRVQPGVRWADLADHLEPLGLAPMTSPTSRFSTVGGWASTGGVGLGSYGYGPLSEAVVAARMALPGGEVETLTADEPHLQQAMGAEGQLGVFTELTLRVRPRPGFCRARLLQFPDGDRALDFVQRLVDAGLSPAHVTYRDRASMAEVNLLARDRFHRDEEMVPERDAVLLHFDRQEQDRRFVELVGDDEELADQLTELDAAARYLWAGRFFPLAGHRLGPGLLASEVVIELEHLSSLVRRARRLAKRFGVEPALEVILIRGEAGVRGLVITSFCGDSRWPLSYSMRLLLAQLLTHLGVRRGGRPYGLGIWNAAFFGARYTGAARQALVRRKREVDPAGLLNPMKFFGVRTRHWGIPGLLFRPWIQRAALRCAGLATPLWALLARPPRGQNGHRWDPPDARDDGPRLLDESSCRCVACGACLSTCPAYTVTRDERATGRGKMRLVQALNSGEALAPNDAASPFQCLHCHLCEEVCQTRLPLVQCYEALERRLEDEFGLPAETIEKFEAAVDADRQRLVRLFGLDLPAWSSGHEQPQGPGPAREDA